MLLYNTFLILHRAHYGCVFCLLCNLCVAIVSVCLCMKTVEPFCVCAGPRSRRKNRTVY
ncbi:hypothetical protein BDZ91DRAFT_724561 [Kalaharituber pfeilii]|nr:hypothetical protein BDZ91DRAFT_724561 [Kalaharituber pfeilii]